MNFTCFIATISALVQGIFSFVYYVNVYDEENHIVEVCFNDEDCSFIHISVDGMDQLESVIYILHKISEEIDK